MEARDGLLILMAVVVTVESLAIVALFRLVGQLFVRLGPSAPPNLEAGPGIGETISTIAADSGDVTQIGEGHTILVFLKSGCRPCHSLAPSLQPFGRQYGVRIVAVVSGDDPGRFLGLEGVTRVHLRDAVEAFGIDSTPFVIWLKDAAVVAKSVANHMEHLESLWQSVTTDTGHGHGHDGAAASEAEGVSA